MQALGSFDAFGRYLWKIACRGKGRTGWTGRICRVIVRPTPHAHGLGERPEPHYSVIFAAGELWEAPEHARDEVALDLWESYLEPA